jgi:outer membrane receptor for ferrienterochelin and colicin
MQRQIVMRTSGPIATLFSPLIFLSGGTGMVTSALAGHENMPRKNELGAMHRRTSRAALLALLASLTLTTWPQQTPTDLTNESIEDLMNIQVTSVSKTEQNLSQAASAVFVITPDDIRRSGAINIPDLLRMVPGLDVARINANTWAVSARGFNARYSNELLVLMDGRTTRQLLGVSTGMF